MISLYKTSKLMVAATIAIAAASCGHNQSPQENIDDARNEFISLNYGRCQNICDNIMADTVRFNELSVHQLCDLAELYTLIDTAVNGNDPNTVAGINDANATKCLTRARTLNADSVDIYLSEFSPESAQRLNVLNRVSAYLNIPRDSLAVEDEAHSDSI